MPSYRSGSRPPFDDFGFTGLYSSSSYLSPCSLLFISNCEIAACASSESKLLTRTCREQIRYLTRNFSFRVDWNFYLYKVKFLACPARLELATYGLEGRCSIQLSYGQIYSDSSLIDRGCSSFLASLIACLSFVSAISRG